MMPDAHAPKEMAVHCPQCDAVGVCTPRGFTTYYEPAEGPPERWTLLKCPHGHALLVLQNEYGEATGSMTIGPTVFIRHRTDC
jgi:hypothetical protein